MEGRRIRRFGRRHSPHSHNQNILPMTTSTPPSHLSNSLSCWYCDYKFCAFNEPLYRLGRKHARCLGAWFSIGVGFSLTALFAVTMILVWELGRSLHIIKGGIELSNIFSSLLFGFAPSGSYSSMRVSLGDTVYLFISAIVSVSVHEFGHALAAASEGIKMEYIAAFIAVLFPGALVAFSDDFLQALPRFSHLRVYCAGIWHNAIVCVVCGLVLFLLPLILSPFYVHGESVTVLDVPSTSPLSGYVSPGDVIVSLDEMPINDVRNWLKVTALVGKQSLQNSNSTGTDNNRKGYCVPSLMLKETNAILLSDNQSACLNDLTAFVPIPCSRSNVLINGSSEDGQRNKEVEGFCLSAADIVKLNKCGDGRIRADIDETTCKCLQDESCLAPILMPGTNWVEVTYVRLSSPECLAYKEKPPNSETSSIEQNCRKTFVFVGDIISMAHSVYLTDYRPRWGSIWGAYLPMALEKFIMCIYHVSLTIALFNSLPVYFLDGEPILEAILGYFVLSSRKRRKVLRVCLTGGSFVTVLTFLRIFRFL